MDYHFICRCLTILCHRSLSAPPENMKKQRFCNACRGYMTLLEGKVVKPFHVIGLFLYPLKTSENQRFSDVFRGYRKRPVA